MADLFLIYSNAFVLLAIALLTLPFVGINLMAQKRVTEFLSLTQFSVLSLFVGFLLFHRGVDHGSELGPLVVSIILTSTLFFSLNVIKKIDNNFFLMLYIFFLL